MDPGLGVPAEEEGSQGEDRTREASREEVEVEVDSHPGDEVLAKIVGAVAEGDSQVREAVKLLCKKFDIKVC